MTDYVLPAVGLEVHVITSSVILSKGYQLYPINSAEVNVITTNINANYNYVLTLNPAQLNILTPSLNIKKDWRLILQAAQVNILTANVPKISTYTLVAIGMDVNIFTDTVNLTYNPSNKQDIKSLDASYALINKATYATSNLPNYEVLPNG